MKIDTQLNQIEATSLRLMKYVRYFAKNYMTDKFILCMICLIAVALVVVIVVLAIGDRANEDEQS